MTTRIIRPDEWNRLAPVFAAEGGRLPDPAHATAAIAEDERGLAGCWTAQHVIHSGPLWIREDLRGTRLWMPLNEKLNELFSGTPKGSGYYSFSDSPRMDHVFERLGYTDLGYKVWKKEF